jgi:hypothetical protein
MLMKNIQFSSPETDRKVWHLVRKVLIVSCCLAIPASVGLLSPTPLDDPLSRLIVAAFTAALGVFVWGIFGLVAPMRQGRNWKLAKFVGIPIVWLCLVFALAILLSFFEVVSYDTDGLKEMIVRL